MTLRQLASEVAKREGKKSEVRIGDIREIIKILIDLEVEALLTPHNSPLELLASHAVKKYRRKVKKA